MQRTHYTLNPRLAALLAGLSESTYLSAIRTGMVSVVPLTIIGGLFMIVSYLPVPGWDTLVEPVLNLLQVPVSATFGLLSVYVCFAISYDLGKRLGLEAVVSAILGTAVFLMLQLQPGEQPGDVGLALENLGSQGLFTAILISLISVSVQKFLTERNLVIKLPRSVPPIVYESFVSLVPLCFLVAVFWTLRFLAGVDINETVRAALKPLLFAMNTLPGILVYAFLVTLLWSIGINGDNALDAFVAAFFLDYLAANVEAMAAGQPLPYITANGFFTTFVNVGGTGATIALALVMWNSSDPGYRKISRVSMPTQIFQINEPIFFGFPIVLNPVFMIPYILNALILTAATYLLMQTGMIQRPFINVPWTTPPIIGHYLVTGGDWRAALWGATSILIAMAVYYPFARAAERQRLNQTVAQSSPR